ncbi:penicillin-binding protein [Oceanobacillus iheyensis HTE831]|uniref:Penicillin-binding protein n=2 Tax=Oceanobacillus iheyensis TaxID=182710 RepID=Q8EM43_OCEIH|nr:penicillin-binding protein [Oceanobacillus iheyensis HTE831]
MMKQSKIWKRIRTIIWVIVGLVITAILGTYIISYLLGPPELAGKQPTTVYDRYDEKIGEERLLNSMEWVPLEDMNKNIIQATLLIEDQQFFEHNGFNYQRIAKAIWTNITHGSLKEGASTITQQYARNLYLSPEKKWSRKIQEAFYAIRLEMFYSKEEILEGYLNTIYYGHGAYGIEAASRYFFDTTATDLSLAQAAMLAGIPKGPTYYSPLNNEKLANERQQLILSEMLQHGVITQEGYNRATQEKLIYAETAAEEEVAPYFSDEAVLEAAELLDIATEEIQSGGYELYTTLDLSHQSEMDEAVSKNMNGSEDLETAGVSINPKTGEITAMTGGKNYLTSSYNRSTKSKRMAGSSFKPILYYEALENGYTPSTRLVSEATTFTLEDGTTYQPGNFNGYYANGPITLAQAIALSDNIYAVKTNLYLGPKNLVETAKDFGITSELDAVPSLALGTSSISVLELTQAYGRIANGGKEIEPYTIRKIIDKKGNTVYEHDNDKLDQVLDEKNTFILTQLLTGMFDEELNNYTSVTGSTINHQLSNIYAGKSGTTDYDSWMVGYSPEVVTGIWVGYDDHRKITQVQETTFSKQIWANYMEAIHEPSSKHTFAMPSGVIGLPIDPVSGKRATSSCGQSRIMFFEKGTEPLGYCTDRNHPEDLEEEENDQKGFMKKIFDEFF